MESRDREQPILNIVGESMALGPLSRDHLPAFLRWLNDNERGIRAYRRAGFREIGRRREVFERGGRLHAVVYMDCLATEFESPLLRRQMLNG
jgi:hypothetical protein